ncbi:MAG: relaxase/mobilization nuclease domain-containing protein [Clostridiales bacterium]|nr:relaxase/mobilization nuclease domain-containing protein [Clostridiales bacterium]
MPCIISFDPQDRELGLMLGRAQELCLEFARIHFPGRQMLACAHEDGQNGTGNIHVHIVLNSLNSVWKLDTEPLPCQQRKDDCKAGCKHNCTKELMKFLRTDVMKMCQDAGLQCRFVNHTLHTGKEERTSFGERQFLFATLFSFFLSVKYHCNTYKAA